MRIRRTLLIIAACALLVAGCGDDDTTTDDTAGETPDRSEETSVPDDTPDEDEPDDDSQADQAIAEGALLTLSDFPSGWTEQRADDEEDEREEEHERSIAECLGVDYERLYGDDVNAESPTFVSPEDEEVSNTAGIEDTEQDAIFVMETLASDDAARCFAEEFQKLIENEDIGEGVEVGAVSFDRLSIRDIGDQSNGFRVTIPLTVNEMEVDAYLDVAVARVGRGGVTVQAFSTFTPFDTAELERYTELVTDRLREGLADA